ncbi:MAG: hypothetical protein ISS61_15835, partial [Desulfobacteraceae bacterium]|nr:hypothetical protein [Desulfobacteraceae bacterium]
CTGNQDGAGKGGELRPALERALKANLEGKPAVVGFIVDGWDFAPGFKNFYDRLG